MPDPATVHVIVPTVRGREAKLRRCVKSYLTTAPQGVRLHLHVMTDYQTCGEAWETASSMITAAFAGADHYLHYSADDLIIHPGSIEQAIAQTRRGSLPAPFVHRPDGSVEGAGGWLLEQPDGAEATSTVIPFFPLHLYEKIRPIPPIHYHSDDYVATALRKAGATIRVNYAYIFTHSLDNTDPGRDVAREGEEDAMRRALDQR